MSNQSKSDWSISSTWILVIVSSALWWWYAGEGDPHRRVLLIGLSLSSFAIGSTAGFLFTSFGEEQGTLGKIRDWLIGGLTGVTIAEAMEKGGSFKALLLNFKTGSTDGTFGLVLSMAAIYTCLGFFFMFFQRELILNLLLATKRAERIRIEGARQTGILIQQLASVLPASMLSGIDDISTLSSSEPEEAEKLRVVLYSEEVEKFVLQTSDAIRDGVSIDWDIVSKMAYVQYYRTYFEKEKRQAQIHRSLDWLERALVMNPLHADLMMKYADMLATDKQYEEAVELLERLNRRPDASYQVAQWLGYFLLFLPGRQEDAIRYSDGFHKIFPNDADPIFNIACAHAQLYGVELRKVNKKSDPTSASRMNALKALKEALILDPGYATVVRTRWVSKGEDFEALKDDEEFLSLLKSFETSQALATSSKENMKA